MSRGRAATGPVLLALLLGLPSVAAAQFSRVFASAQTGNDGNSCNNINTPCQTLQGAVNQVAAGGSVLILDTGGYGPVSIGKALTIEAPVGIEAFIHPPSGSAITILAGAGDVVVLRGLTLSGGDFGIDYLIAGAVHVERCVIQGFVWDGISASRLVATVYGDLYVEDTIVRNCSFIGISASTGSGLIRATVDRCHLVGNPGFGLGGDENSRTVAWKTVAAGNEVGISLFARNFHSSEMFIEQCTADNNQVAGIQVQGDIFDSPATLWVSDSTVTGNGGPASNWAGFRNLGSSLFLSRVNNTVEGNAHDTSGSIGTYLAK